MRRVLRHLLYKSRDFAALNLNILYRPTWTGSNVIVDDEPAGVLRALKFYSKAFALAFAIYVVASRFKLYEGDSEWRILVTYSVQLLLGGTIIYVLCLALPERIQLLRLAQAVLYVDGAFIVANAAASVPLSSVETLPGRQLAFLLAHARRPQILFIQRRLEAPRLGKLVL